MGGNLSVWKKFQDACEEMLAVECVESCSARPTFQPSPAHIERMFEVKDGLHSIEQCQAHSLSTYMALPAYTEPVLNNHDRQQEDAAEHSLPVGTYPVPFIIQDIKEHAEQQHSYQRRADASLPARQQRPPDDDRGDGVQFKPHAGDGLA